MINNEDLQVNYSWLHVSNGMPEPGEKVLCFGPVTLGDMAILILGEKPPIGEDFRSCYWFKSHGLGAVAHPYNSDGTVSARDISHWMHLPPTP